MGEIFNGLVWSAKLTPVALALFAVLAMVTS